MSQVYRGHKQSKLFLSFFVLLLLVILNFNGPMSF